MTTKQFKPIFYSKKYKLHSRLIYGRREDISYLQDRLLSNISIMNKIFSKLHYLGSHNPAGFNKRWYIIERKFLIIHKTRDF